MKIFTLSLLTVSFLVSCQKEGKPSEKISAKASDSLAAVAAAQYEASLRQMAAPAQNTQAASNGKSNCHNNYCGDSCH